MIKSKEERLREELTRAAARADANVDLRRFQRFIRHVLFAIGVGMVVRGALKFVSIQLGAGEMGSLTSTWIGASMVAFVFPLPRRWINDD